MEFAVSAQRANGFTGRADYSGTSARVLARSPDLYELRKNVPFAGRVWPWCKHNKANNQQFEVVGMAGGIFGAIIGGMAGGMVWAILVGFAGLIVGCVAVTVNAMTRKKGAT